MKLGKGTFGKVIKENGMAIKHFHRYSDVIQEYSMLKILSDCDYIVRTNGFNLNDKKLAMDLYDCTFRDLLDKNNYNRNDLDHIIHDILLGLIELHDKNLVHGDLKPNNILIKLNPLKVVLGDCGFVSIGKYAKVNLTARGYREIEYEHDYKHDMFSFGIIMLKVFGEFKSKDGNPEYDDLYEAIKKSVKKSKIKNILFNLLSENRDIRFSARKTFEILFEISPPVKQFKIIYNGDLSLIGKTLSKEYIEKLSNNLGYLKKEYKLKRCAKGFKALLYYLENISSKNKIDYKIYVVAIALIISALFTNYKFEHEEARSYLDKKYDRNLINHIITNMIGNYNFLSILIMSKKK